MPRCPDCNFPLVLREYKRKYKCAKCSKVFSQGIIEDEEFKKKLKREKEVIKKKVGKEIKELLTEERELNAKIRKSKKLTDKEKKQRARDRYKKYFEQNKEKEKQRAMSNWAKNRNEILKRKRETYKKRKAEILTQQKLYRQNNKSLAKVKARRWEQKLLAVRMFENHLEKLYKAQIQSLLPTFVHSDLLV